MTVGYDDGIKDFGPPYIHAPKKVVFAKGQFPFLGPRLGCRDLGNILHRCTEHQVLIELVQRDVIFEILPRYVMRRERTVRESLV